MIIEPHHDDHSWQWGFAGLVSRMIDEGYRGYFVRVSNDEKDGPHGYPHNDMVNLREAQTAVAHLGINDVISLNWRNDYMDPTPIKELRAQLILLIRKLRPDAVMSWDPWGHYDRNPDHRKVARAVAEAVWMAGYANIRPEHLKLGVKPPSRAARLLHPPRRLRQGARAEHRDRAQPRPRGAQSRRTVGPPEHLLPSRGRPGYSRGVEGAWVDGAGSRWLERFRKRSSGLKSGICTGVPHATDVKAGSSTPRFSTTWASGTICRG